MQDFHWYNAIPWLIALAALIRTEIREWKNKDAGQAQRLQALEIAQRVDQATVNGQLALINQRIDQTSQAVNQAKTMLSSISSNLDHA